jgi:hypothetical protein
MPEIPASHCSSCGMWRVQTQIPTQLPFMNQLTGGGMSKWMWGMGSVLQGASSTGVRCCYDVVFVVLLCGRRSCTG